jgi:hypothetical protein
MSTMWKEIKIMEELFEILLEILLFGRGTGALIAFLIILFIWWTW